jgi:hypothetical protein
MPRIVMAMLMAASCALALQEQEKESPPPITDTPTTQPAGRTKPRNPRQARIYEALLRDSAQERVQMIISREPGEAVDEGVVAGEGARTLLREGKVLSELTGRLVRTGDRSEFHFKAGAPGGGAQDVMEFNKNGWLEMMEAESEAGVKEFIVTVEFTIYRGRNYLNLVKFRRQVSHGNLSP